MTRLIVVLALLLAVAHPAAAAAPPAELWLWKGATLTPLLAPTALAPLDVRLAGQFEVLGRGRIVALTSGGDLLDLASRRTLPATAPLALTSFTADKALLIAVRGRRLGWYDGAALVEKIRLPQDGLMVVAGAKKRFYLYGPHGNGSAVYLLEQNRAGTLFEVPDGRVSALTAIGERLFFAVDNTIYTAAEGQRPAVVFVAAAQPAIRSIAADPRTGLLYFSAGSAVYAMRAGMAISILRGLEGTLRYSGDALYVLDASRGVLVKLQGLDTLLELGTGGGQPAPDAAPAQFKE